MLTDLMAMMHGGDWLGDDLLQQPLIQGGLIPLELHQQVIFGLVDHLNRFFGRVRPPG